MVTNRGQFLGAKVLAYANQRHPALRAYAPGPASPSLPVELGQPHGPRHLDEPSLKGAKAGGQACEGLHVLPAGLKSFRQPRRAGQLLFQRTGRYCRTNATPGCCPVVMLYLSASPELDHHQTGAGHPERPERVVAALQGLEELGLAGGAVVRLAPRRATPDELLRVHTAAYLKSLQQFCLIGGGRLDSDTVAREGSWDTALLAAGGALAAVDALTGAREGVAFVAHRPPGHHATPDQAMGFCLLNNAAVAAAALVARGERVLVLDWDVHHGNGTQAIFWDDPGVLYVSIHQWPLYPGTGQAEAVGGPNATGLTLNVPVPPGATGDIFIRALDEVVAPAVEAFVPDWVLISCGFDAHRADPLAQLDLSAGDFADMAGRAKDFAPSPGRVIVVLEGGYDLDAVRLGTGAVLAGFLGEPYHPEPATSGGPGNEEVARAVAVRARLGLGPGQR
jgi:acetoin utilization deacetylase AcuC-like enzyme